MRRLSLGSSLGDDQDSFNRWAMECFQQIEQASAEDIEAVIGEFTVTGAYTPTRTLDASAATLANVRAFIATLITDIKNKGQKRGYST